MTQEHTQKLKSLDIGKKITLEKLSTGALLAYKQKNGTVNFHFRYYVNGKDYTYPLGSWDTTINANSLKPSLRGHSVKSAIQACGNVALEQNLLNAQNKSVNERREEDKIEKAKQKEKASRQKDKTLGNLLDLYQKTLVGTRSEINVKSYFKNIPQYLMKRQANQIDYREFDSLIGQISTKKITIGDKVHAFLRAAYNQAIKPTSLLVEKNKFYDFEIEKNPLERIASNYQFNPENTKPLSTPELKNYYANLKIITGFQAAGLRLHCLLGGVRILQLCALKKSDIFLNSTDEFCDYLTLWDGKIKKDISGTGKRKPYYLPITPAIKKELNILLENATDGEFLFSMNNGKTKIGDGTFRSWAYKIQDENPNKILNFTPKRIRSAITILMNYLGVPMHVSNQIQSHGALGVVERHYTYHDKNLERKSEALNKLFVELNPLPEYLKVVRESA